MATYGPTDTSAPAGAIIVHPGDNVAAIVSGAAAGATFYFKAGTYDNVSIAPKTGQTLLGEKAATLNGHDTTAVAFQQSGAQNVTVQNLIVTHYHSPVQQGAIGGGAFDGTA